MAHKSGRGGSRPGAGRPPGSPDSAPRKKRSNRTELLGTRLSPAEKAALTAYLAKLREHSTAKEDER